MPYRAVLAALALVALALVAGAAPAAAQVFVFHLSGDQEAPPVPSLATGGCYGDLDQGAGTFELFCSHSVSGATVMHVHRGAASVNGPIAFDLGDPTSPVHATWTGMTPADVAELLAGDLYVNVHTSGRPEGEIRGQILTRTVDMVSFDLEGAQVVPPSGSAATGSCTADLDGPATALQVDCTHDLTGATAAHVHEAPVGQNGPQIFAFASPASPLSAAVPLTPQQVADFAAGFLYVDVHLEPAVEGDPSGEIRGQIADLPAAPTTGTIVIEKATFPGGGIGFAFTDDVPGSPGVFTLDDGGSETFLDVPPGTYTVTEDDPEVVPGGYVLAHVECSDGDSTGNRFARTATIQLEAGETVSCTFENQELAAGQPFVFGLDGGQEAPPVPSPATGGCMGFFDAGAASFSLVCTHDVVGATTMHIHRGAPGTNGPIVFDLGDPESPVLATWTGMSPADVADLLAGNLYVNIHTGGRPGGEIRGQILERTHDRFDFLLVGFQQVPPVDTNAIGSCTADLNDPATELFLACTHTVAGATAAHIHQAPAGENGPVLIELGDPASPFSLNAPLSPRDVADLVAGFLYVNIHSESAPDGEIRGQIVNAPQQSLLEIPTLGEWGLLLLALALGAVATWKLGA